MARRVKKARKVAPHDKTFFKVGLNARDTEALLKLVERERAIRGVAPQMLGGATILGEYAMPLVHARNAELQALEQEGIEASPERRIGPDRRHPELTPTT